MFKPERYYCVFQRKFIPNPLLEHQPFTPVDYDAIFWHPHTRIYLDLLPKETFVGLKGPLYKCLFKPLTRTWNKVFNKCKEIDGHAISEGTNCQSYIDHHWDSFCSTHDVLSIYSHDLVYRDIYHDLSGTHDEKRSEVRKWIFMDQFVYQMADEMWGSCPLSKLK